jgi:hypothetical protein
MTLSASHIFMMMGRKSRGLIWRPLALEAIGCLPIGHANGFHFETEENKVFMSNLPHEGAKVEQPTTHTGIQ